MHTAVVDPRSEPARYILDLYGIEMRQRYGDDAPYGSKFLPDGVDEEGGAFILALDETDNPVGCTGLRRLDKSTAEIKLMFVRPEFRRMGIARLMLQDIEELAKSRTYKSCRLNTGPSQPEAFDLYVSAGFTPIEAYNENPYAAYWFEKELN